MNVAPSYLSNPQVEALLSPADAFAAVREAFCRASGRAACSWRRASGCVARISGAGALTLAPTCSGKAGIVRASQVQHALEDVDGARSTSVTRRSSVCEHSPSLVTRLNRLTVVSARDRPV